LTISLCYELKECYDKVDGKAAKQEEWNKMADNFFRFIMDNFTTELVVMASRIAITTYGIPFVPGKLKTFDEFHKRFGKYVVAAVGNK
jgi:hypothetical protein